MPAAAMPSPDLFGLDSNPLAFLVEVRAIKPIKWQAALGPALPETACIHAAGRRVRVGGKQQQLACLGWL
jgi:hypothetical protein